MTTLSPNRPAGNTTMPLGNRNRKILQRIIIYTILIVVALIVLMPMLWMLSTSFKPKSQWFLPEIYWIPKTITLDNYQKILNNPSLPIVRWFFNSAGLATVITLSILVVDSLAGYAYARLEFPGRRLLFGILLATLFLPGIMFLVPNFLTIARLNLLNNYVGVIIPAMAGVFGVFLMRQFFESIPKELEEAARIDGATTFQTFYYIALPLAKPALVTLGVITFLGSWNDFLWPLLILKDRALLTLPPGLRTLQGAFTSEYGQMMAGAAITAVPVLIIYLVLQRYIVESVATSGLKG
jgi:multiple sugar transport system permease protein